jgi:hypothetical protein
MKVGDLQVYLNRLGATPPHIKFWIQNYHMEKRVRTGKNGVKHTEEVRVNTHFATEYFQWGDCVDRSPEPDSVEIIKKYRLTRVVNGLSVSYTPEAHQSFLE